MNSTPIKTMTINKLVAQTRTCRRFTGSPITTSTLMNLIELARLSGSARNGQPWQYSIINDQQSCCDIFPHLGWAGYLADWKGPAPEERPTAYILCLLNHDRLNVAEKHAHFDLGIASQNILLGACEQHILGCRIGAFSPEITRTFNIPDNLTLELIIALGEPKEKIVIEEAKDKNDIQYWRDTDQIHHVPKRPLKELLVTLERTTD
ncbi:nitroreductase family protein [Desulfosediminicola flagellatus]|uniref:nitroreductase family protein n=1 Tax=Desulfosediminicola flagellatus TaxID=2569541 RepID=UPI001E3F2586|nr:nitroreductase family protein [Desulfosediminicola flagellatus]